MDRSYSSMYRPANRQMMAAADLCCFAPNSPYLDPRYSHDNRSAGSPSWISRSLRALRRTPILRDSSA
ncbi:unnamed protein product [Peniophora sp. CBMAI 1063]|nr:unnamed protein product [Peniophora sp. CBMAI 1063]